MISPRQEHIEGVLCGKGLMKEKYNHDTDELERSLTTKGINVAEDLLKDKEFIREYLLMAKDKFSKFPIETQQMLWKNLINQIERINTR